MTMLRLYLLLFRASVRSRMQYKLNFLLSSGLAAFINLMEFLLIAIILQRFGDIKGWSLYEIGYLYSVLLLSRAIYRILASDVHHIEKYLVGGELDQLLTRPIPVLLALMTQNVTILLGEVIQGTVLLVLCFQGLLAAGQIGWLAIPQTALVILAGSVILFAIGLLSATAGFWLTRVRDLQNITEDAARNAAQYPLVLYPGWLRMILLTLVPVGFANYVPALYILRGEYGPWLLLVSTAAAVLLLWVSFRFWRLGLSRYQSAGS
ncbi:ABC transporter permease [Paenibacillus sp. J31TS4]|uniref:ABC transporter permease n=1 Tax=Paenibacillus sp. J31TS4 TaxID=2807195 RepID=UPI001B05252B|nr:ABC-2 family transporter protein [Paenibacillus sp. J31TS4]GIP38063.1 ABC transporter permease [Paenibacillus sp. J31TS4]